MESSNPALYVAQVASTVPNAGPHQEYKGTDDTVPLDPGVGVAVDPAYVKRATVVS